MYPIWERAEDTTKNIVDLYKPEMNLAELSSEYGIAKWTINGWIKDVKGIKVDDLETEQW